MHWKSPIAFINIQTNWVIRTVMLGFAQTTQLPELRKLFTKALHMIKDEADTSRKKMEEEQLTVSVPWDVFVTDSTEPAFTDKLMMFYAGLMNGASIEQYGFSIATSIRNDLAVMYGKIFAEVLRFAEDGANLMIEKQWLEMMPLAANREELIKV